jgi:hypothetical protein
MEILNQTSREEHTNNEHLNLLSIFYFVFGGLSLMLAFVMLIYTVVFGAIFSNPSIRQEMDATEPVVGYVFGIVSIIFLVIFVLVLSVGILQIVAGFKIRQKKNRIFNIVIGSLALPSFPLGTALGVFTIIVLSKPSVIAMFQREQEKQFEDKYGKLV